MGPVSLLPTLTCDAIAWLPGAKAVVSFTACPWLGALGRPSLQRVGRADTGLPPRADTWRHKDLGTGSSRQVSRLSLPSSLAYQSSPASRRRWALVQRLGSYYFVSLLDFVLLFKPPSAGNLEGREVSSRIEAPNLPGTPHKGPMPQQLSQDAKDVILKVTLSPCPGHSAKFCPQTE